MILILLAIFTQALLPVNKVKMKYYITHLELKRLLLPALDIFCYLETIIFP